MEEDGQQLTEFAARRIMADQSNHALIATTAVAASAGLVTTWKLYKDWQKIQMEKARNLPDHASEIDPKDLAILATSSNFALKKSAEQVLLDRMMTGEHLEFLLKQCNSPNQTEMKKAIAVLSLMSKSREFKQMLIKHNIFEVISKSINMMSDGFRMEKLDLRCYLDYEVQKTLHLCIVTLLDLVSDSEGKLKKFFKTCKELIAFLLELICDPSDTISSDIRRFSILILQQMIQHEQMRCNLISYGMIQRISLCFLRTLGDTWISRNCLQILVMQINLFEDYVTEEFLQEMAQLGIIPVLIGCLKSEDPDLIYWSTALIHEFLLKDLHRSVIAKIPNLVKTLYHILISSESSLQRLILRIYCFLSINDDNFKKRLLNFKPLLKRMSICLASGNNDLLYWSLLLVHDLAMMGKNAALKMMKANEDLLKSIITLTQASVDGPCDVKLVAETLGFFCSCESLHKKVVEAGCIKVILQLLKSENTELQFWASSLLLNLAMSSDDARGRVIKDGGIGMLLEMAVKESEMPQITAQASKILVMLGFTDATLQVDLNSGLDSNIRIDGKEHSPMKHGINLVTVDFLNFKISKGKAFDLGSPVDAVNLLAELKNHRQNELLLLTTQGKVNSYITEVQGTNIFFALEEFGLKSKLLEGDGSWCVVAQAKRNSPVIPITAKQGPNNVDLTVTISLAAQVNSFVEDDLLKPLLNILMSTPAGSSISKVPELEILSTLARHEEHQKVILSMAGLLEYLSELIWCFACLETDQLSTKPLMIAHCIGAMKICHSLSTNTEYRDKLFHGPVLGAIKSFLITNCNVLLLNLKESAEYIERTASRYYPISSADDVFIGSETPRDDSEAGSKFGVYAEWSQNAMAGRTESDVSRNVDSVGNAEAVDARKRTSFYEPKHSEVQDDRSDLISPFCRDPKARADEIEELIAQVTFEKAFNKDRDDLSADERKEFRQKIREISKEDMEATAGPSTNPERETLSFTFEEETRESGAARSARNRDSRLSERSKGSSAAKRSESELGRRFDDDYHENFEYDEFEEEDLPPILDNDDDELYFSQGRGFFDVTRMASAQRMRSSSAFNPNDWPTTRSGCLSRTLSEAAQRAKSPLKDIASDLEDFDEALVNLTNYALMTVYFAVYGRRFENLKNRSDVSKLVQILWCVLLSCKQESRMQIGIITSSILSHLCTTSSEETADPHEDSNVLLNAKEMTSSMIISNDLLEVYNGNWTFESISATAFVNKSSNKDQQPLGWCYEVTLLSKGIMQIGWRTDSSKFEPEKGLGVGDSRSSVGFDGSRCKLWNGQGVFDDEADNSYGRKWALGDTITCLLSMNGNVSFQLNGQDLGVGLKGLDTNLRWFPAISLSLDQHCRVNFGKDPFIFEIPAGYLSIEDATKPSMSTSKSTSFSSCLGLSDSKNDNPEVNLKYLSKDLASPRNIDSRSSYSKSPAVFDRRTPSSREIFKYRHRSGLDFSPKDLLGAQGPADIFEVLYFEVMCNNADESTHFEIGYQSTTRNLKSTCTIKGHSVYISTQNGNDKSKEVIQFEETIGCGLLWPLKKVFFSVDGVGTQFSTDLVDSGEQWTENLDEIIPYFSQDRLRVNFGQSLFCSQAMNVSTYRRNCTQLMYDVILASEESV